jgi:hypothetical protein
MEVLDPSERATCYLASTALFWLFFRGMEASQATAPRRAVVGA